MQEKLILSLTFNPGLTLTGFRTTRREWNLLWLSRRLVFSTEQIKQGLHKHFSYYFDFRGTGERSRDKYIFFNRPFGSSVLRTP